MYSNLEEMKAKIDANQRRQDGMMKVCQQIKAGQ
jgi:hypothetical protein